MLTVALYAVAIIAYVAFTFVFVDVLKATYRHYSRGNANHLMPLPIHLALIVAIVEVCWDRPIAFHRSRMEAVRRMEQARADALLDTVLRHPSNFDLRQEAMLRHPSNFAARQACMANHPSNSARLTLPTAS